ncbi:MAG TPA: hypothetical protein VNB49_08015, partial [Candidatus Dormibacteraeota bacterium]|nr:hypothetical protein [Candidatus Dormibacteraeota bacterium]
LRLFVFSILSTRAQTEGQDADESSGARGKAGRGSERGRERFGVQVVAAGARVTWTPSSEG